ncbi:MAG: ribosome maturation factor RimM [Eubacterium sp.]|nr:ribosome maturation factor RimM [Eubacterium sp.]
MKQYLEIGKLINTHGIRGEMKLELWCDDIEYVKQFKTLYLADNGAESLTLLSARPQKNHAIVKFAEIASIDEAEKFKNSIVYCNRDDAEIDEDANYIQDLIGCSVVHAESNEEYGKVADVVNYGASDILDVVNDKKHSYIPVIPDIVQKIDTENELIKIIPMKGLFDED